LVLTAVIITLNEADRLQKCLPPLSFCQEIIVVDSGSTDGTQAFAEKLGARVVHRDFDGFGPQKAFAVAQAKNDWVLCLDADEYLDTELAAAIQLLFSQGMPTSIGYRLRRRFFFLGKELKRGGETAKGYIRLFNRTYGTYNQAQVHEQVELDGKTHTLPGFLLHESYRDLHDYLNRFNKYTTQAAEELFAKGKKASWVQIYLRFPINFFRLLFLKGLVLDGYPGWIWAFLSSVYPVVKYAKLRELWAKAKEPLLPQ
jgi:glycosyltransferase involved in cell wall biosynthesis